MKRLLFIITYFLFLFVPLTVLQAEEIEFFDALYEINKDGSVSVTETIQYDFENDIRHGIFRTIPTIKINTEGKRYRLDFERFSVTKESVKHQFSQDTSNGNITLKIGDPNATVTGLQTYTISYVVKGALTYFSDHDELYWNVTGNDWNIPIRQIQAKVSLPESVNPSQLQFTCFTGQYESTSRLCTIDPKTGIITASSFSSNEGMTIVFGFPKSIVSVLEPKLVTSPLENPFVLLGILVIVFVWYIFLPFWIGLRWWKKGRDPKSIVGDAHVWFSAPKFPNKREITPAELSLLLHEHVKPQAITGTIINLAHKGYLTITKMKNNEFTLTKKDIKIDSLQPHETTLLNGIFKSGNSVSSKKLDLFKTFEILKQEMADASVKDGLFVKNPERQRNLYIGLSLLGLFTGNLLLFLSSILFGKNMPQRTQIGVDMKAMGLALKEFLVSQKHQLTFQAKELFLFEQLLPFATALGVEKIWANRFKDMNVPKPEWYNSNDSFNSLLFVNSFKSSFKTVEGTMTTTKSSTGHSSGFSGGFSGGGGGGGGGGSW